MDEDLLRQAIMARILPTLTGDLGDREVRWIRRALDETILPWFLEPIVALAERERLPAAAGIANDLLFSLLPLPAVTRFQEIIHLHYTARVGRIAADAFACARARVDSGVATPEMVRRVVAIQGRIGSVARELHKLHLVPTADFLPILADAMLDCRYAMFGKAVTTLHVDRYLRTNARSGSAA